MLFQDWFHDLMFTIPVVDVCLWWPTGDSCLVRSELDLAGPVGERTQKVWLPKLFKRLAFSTRKTLLLEFGNLRIWDRFGSTNQYVFPDSPEHLGASQIFHVCWNSVWVSCQRVYDFQSLATCVLWPYVYGQLTGAHRRFLVKEEHLQMDPAGFNGRGGYEAHCVVQPRSSRLTRRSGPLGNELSNTISKWRWGEPSESPVPVLVDVLFRFPGIKLGCSRHTQVSLRPTLGLEFGCRVERPFVEGWIVFFSLRLHVRPHQFDGFGPPTTAMAAVILE